MRINCPHCGERDVREFTYLGDASLQRPDPQVADAVERFTIRPRPIASFGTTAPARLGSWSPATRVVTRSLASSR